MFWVCSDTVETVNSYRRDPTEPRTLVVLSMPKGPGMPGLRTVFPRFSYCLYAESTTSVYCIPYSAACNVAIAEKLRCGTYGAFILGSKWLNILSSHSSFAPSAENDDTFLTSTRQSHRSIHQISIAVVSSILVAATPVTDVNLSLPCTREVPLGQLPDAAAN